MGPLGRVPLRSKAGSCLPLISLVNLTLWESVRGFYVLQYFKIQDFTNKLNDWLCLIERCQPRLWAGREDVTGLPGVNPLHGRAPARRGGHLASAPLPVDGLSERGVAADLCWGGDCHCPSPARGRRLGA